MTAGGGRGLSDKKSGRTGRPQRHTSDSDAEAICRFASRWDRYGRQRGYDDAALTSFAKLLAIWRELTQAAVQPPVLAKLSAYQRAFLEERFAVAEDDLTEECQSRFGRAPRVSEQASLVAGQPEVRRRFYDTSMRQAERLVDELKTRDYWSGVPALYGLEQRPLRADAQAFWRWYRETA